MEQGKKVKIIVATHKKYQMPTDEMYVPLHVGAEGKTDAQGNPLDLGYQKDDIGDNISEKNASFCELTGLYWAWKNLDADYIGLVHYRRHFSIHKRRNHSFENVLTYTQILPYLDGIRVFVPSKRKYYIETLYSHYAHTHYVEQLDKTRDIIRARHPEYLKSFDRVMKKTAGYMFNMFILKKELFDAYCEWLFDILFSLEEQTELEKLSVFQKRCFGRISEIIFNVWLDYQLEYKLIGCNQIKEFNWIYMEPIKKWEKIKAFLLAKYFGKRYEGSF